MGGLTINITSNTVGSLFEPLIIQTVVLEYESR